MRARSRVVSLGLLIALGASGEARAEGFDATAQARSVGVTVTERTLVCWPPPTGCSQTSSATHADQHAAEDFSPFAATALAAPFVQSFATQDSSLSAVRIAASGGVQQASSGALSTPPNVYATVEAVADSAFSASFDVDAETPYRLAGSVAASGGLSANTATRVTLKTAQGAVLFERVAASDPECQDPGCAQVGPLPFAHEGVLAPGAYVLEGVASGSAAPLYFAGSFLGLASTGAYELELSARAVPALSHAGLALLASALALAGLAGARRSALAERQPPG